MSKTCTKCKTEKPIDNFGKHKGRKDGLNNWCKPCVNSAKPKKSKPKPVVPEGLRMCSTCKTAKHPGEFGINKQSKDGINTRCKLCVRLSKQKSRASDLNTVSKRNTYKDMHVLDQVIYACKSTDKRKKLECNLDKDYIELVVKNQSGLNLYTNTPISWIRKAINTKNTGAHRGSSIDRIDSSKPHVKGNIQIIELWVNRLKLDWNMKTFGKILRRIHTPPNPSTHVPGRQCPKFNKRKRVFLFNKINNTKARQKKMTGKPDLGFDAKDIIKLWESQKRRCAITGIPINIYPTNPYSISIDRIDSEKPYSIKNIHLTAWCINSARSDMELDEFKQLIKEFREQYQTDLADLVLCEELFVLGL